MLMRQKILVDIKLRGNSLRKISPQINLNQTRVIRIPLKFLVSGFFIFFLVFNFLFNFANAPDGGAKAQSSTSAEERKVLESQLAELEKQIDNYENKVSEYKKQGTTLQSEISRINNKIAKLNLQIKSITISLVKINKELGETQTKIVTAESKIDVKRRIISEIIQNIYETEKKGTLNVLLANLRISAFFAELNNLANIQDSLRINLEELVQLHGELSEQKETLALEKTDVESLKAYQENQKVSVQKTKEEKDNLLKVTKGKESEFQKVLTETKKTAAQIRSQIYELLGGGEIKFEDAYKFAKFASEKTGVRAALILAVLDRESALGQNVGRCKYNQINPKSGKPAMHPTRDLPSFFAITEELGINPSSVAVSCANRDGAYGGAMGPAQFIPSTWNIYKDKIAVMTGNSPPSPWNNLDAFMATALYLKDAGADKGTFYAEKVAAAKYYAGSRWSRYLASYGARVIEKARQFQQDIDTLTA